MQLRYDDDFVEGAVFICASGSRKDISSSLIRRFHRDREKLYSILDPDERNAVFFKLHLEWFREWNMEKELHELSREFPLLHSALDFLVFRAARRKGDEGAELYVNSDDIRSVIIALRVERFKAPVALGKFLRHELAHVSDMLDPGFGYGVEELPGQNVSQQRLIRDRYRLLWAISIDGRLTARGQSTEFSAEMRRKEFDRAYSFWPETKREDMFQRLWSGGKPTHRWLMQLASDPRDLAQTHDPFPGGPCPLCGFPTFKWADAPELSVTTVRRISREFSSWTPNQGVCSRCVEMYDATAACEATPVI